MGPISALVDYIECIKEKITDNEYKDILGLLSIIKIQNNNYSKEEQEQEQEILRQSIPDIQIRVFNGREIVEQNARQGWLLYMDRPLKISSQLAAFINIPEDT